MSLKINKQITSTALLLSSSITFTVPPVSSLLWEDNNLYQLFFLGCCVFPNATCKSKRVELGLCCPCPLGPCLASLNARSIQQGNNSSPLSDQSAELNKAR